MWVQQPIKREVLGDGKKGTILHGDARLLRDQLAPFMERVQCLYMDPPFLTGDTFHYKMRVGQSGSNRTVMLHAYRDRMERADYLDFLREMLTLAKDLLSPEGTLFLHIDSRLHAYAKLMLDDLMGEENFTNEIVWVYQTGGRATRHFSRKHDTILMYRKTKKSYFNIANVSIPRKDNRQNHMKRQVDEKGLEYRSIKVNGKTYTYYDDDPVYPSDVWTDVSHLQQKDPQRTGYDTQKPIRLLERIILSTTNPGDLVCDLCAGSGTTLVAAALHNRTFLGVDVGQSAISVCRKRLLDQDCVIEWDAQLNDCRLDAGVLPGLGFYQVELNGYALAPGEWEALKKVPADFTLSPLDAVDQWSVGLIRDGDFYAYEHGARTPKTPALPRMLEAPMLTGQLAVEIIDILGRKTLWIYDLENNKLA